MKMLSLAQRALQPIDTTIATTLKLAGQPGIISMAGGIPHPDLFPVNKIKNLIAEMLPEELQTSLQYSQTAGIPALREHLARDLSEKWGVSLTSEHILITTGSQQGIDLLGKVFLDTGDTVVVERPTYLAAIAAFKNYEAVFEEVTMETLSNTKALENVLSKKPKFMYIIPTFQNPTGHTWSEETREKVALAIKKTGTLIVEDNPYSELRFSENQTLPLWAHIPNQTIYLGTCSKTLVPGLRVGYVVAQPKIIALMTMMKQSIDLHTSTFSQNLALKLMTNKNWYNSHLSRVRNHYTQKAALMEMLLTLHLHDTATWETPKGGMFFWLQTKTNTTELLEKAVHQGVAFMPGAAFYANNPDPTTMRLSFATVSDEEMEKGIEILKEIL